MMSISVRLAYYLSALLIIIAPLYYAGKTAEGLFVIECIGLGLLFFVLWGGLCSKKIPMVLWVYLIVSLGLSLVYLIPVSLDVWQDLPGRSLYLESYRFLDQLGETKASFQLSLVPSETALAILVLLPVLGIFLSALSLPARQLKSLVYILFIIAALQAMLGLVQYASGNPEFLFGMKSHGNSAQGMYANRDHYVALLEMVLPLLLGMLLYSIGRDHIDRADAGGSFPVNQVLLIGFATIIVLVGAIFSRSRAGIFLIMLLVFVSSIVFSRHIGGRQSVGLTAIFLTISAGVATSVGLIPVLNRFIVLDPSEDARWPIFETTIDVIKSFFPLGSGPGTFSEVYRAFQPVDQLRFVNHAHNDYLELLVEMGAAAVFIIVGFWLVYIYGWVRLWGQHWDRMHFLQVGAGLAIFSILLHSLVDFNFHTPANCVVFSFLCGVFLRSKKP